MWEQGGGARPGPDHPLLSSLTLTPAAAPSCCYLLLLLTVHVSVRHILPDGLRIHAPPSPFLFLLLLPCYPQSMSVSGPFRSVSGPQPELPAEEAEAAAETKVTAALRRRSDGHAFGWTETKQQEQQQQGGGHGGCSDASGDTLDVDMALAAEVFTLATVAAVDGPSSGGGGGGALGGGSGGGGSMLSDWAAAAAAAAVAAVAGSGGDSVGSCELRARLSSDFSASYFTAEQVR